MAEDTYSFDQARVRLEEIATQVKRKDTSLEKSLDLLEEGVRLANQCTEQIDHTQWRAVVETPAESDAAEVAPETAEEPERSEEAPGADGETDGGAAAIYASDDVPSEDTHASAEEAPSEDPDVEA